MKLDFHHGLKLQKNLYLEIVRLLNQELLQADSKNELILSLASSKREKKL